MSKRGVLQLGKLSGAGYRSACKILKDSQFAKKRVLLLIKRVETRIQEISIFLSEPDVDDEILKAKISLLSSLLEVKKKLRRELETATSKAGKKDDSLSDLLKE